MRGQAGSGCSLRDRAAQSRGSSLGSGVAAMFNWGPTRGRVAAGGRPVEEKVRQKSDRGPTEVRQKSDRSPTATFFVVVVCSRAAVAPGSPRSIAAARGTGTAALNRRTIQGPAALRPHDPKQAVHTDKPTTTAHTHARTRTHTHTHAQREATHEHCNGRGGLSILARLTPGTRAWA